MIKVTKYIPTIMRENHTHREQIFKKHSINELKMCRSKKLRTKNVRISFALKIAIG